MSRLSVLDRLRAAVPVIAPSMLKCDFGNMHREMQLLRDADAPVFHLDVMDGHFVPNLSYGPMVIDSLRSMTDRPFDAHLMISNPDQFLDDYIDAGCDLITVHIEAVPDPLALLRRIKSADVVCGLALNPGTPVAKLRPFLDECDLILVMSVEPGFGGQSFIPESVPKLTQIRQMVGSQKFVSVDGGIGKSTIAKTAAAGADVFVAGSAIFETPDYRAAIRELAELANGAMTPVSCALTDRDSATVFEH